MIHYVVSVHGMGESRQFATLQPIANLIGHSVGFEIAGDEAKPTHPPRTITLAMAAGDAIAHEDVGAAGEDGVPWVSFEGVPQPGRPDRAGLLSGLPAPPLDPDELRFFDIAWADITREAFKAHGESPETWAAGVLERLKQRRPAAPAWVVRLLSHVRRSVIVLRKLMAAKLGGLSRTVFDDYLGDVQMYGDYARTRGRAVRRFHERMEELDRAHFLHHPDEKPRYTIVAHSLGSIMALDALMYAALPAEQRVFATHGADRNLPFSGYVRNDEKEKPAYDCFNEVAARVPCSWLEDVHAFVTLGSPIDKFLEIWWYRYSYLASGAFGPFEIPHFNYCDEQDPVGHSLDLAERALKGRVLKLEEDRVYNRYPVPGAAHLGYFDDLELFAWIRRRVIRRDADPGNPPNWFSTRAYRRLLRFTYDVVPFAVILLNSGLLIWAWHADGWLSRVTATVLFTGTWWLGRLLIDLSVWWRQLQRVKWRQYPSEPHRAVDAKRAKHAASFRRRLWFAIGFMALATVASSWLLPFDPATHAWKGAGMAAIVVACYLLWRLLLFPRPREPRDDLEAAIERRRTVTTSLGRLDATTVLLTGVLAVAGLALAHFEVAAAWRDKLRASETAKALIPYALVVSASAFAVLRHTILRIMQAKRELGL